MNRNERLDALHTALVDAVMDRAAEVGADNDDIMATLLGAIGSFIIMVAVTKGAEEALSMRAAIIKAFKHWEGWQNVKH
jgi:hypothetical protein